MPPPTADYSPVHPRRLLSAAVLAVSGVAASFGPGQAGAASTTNPFIGQHLYVDSASPAATAEAALKLTNPTGAAALDKIATRSQADWFGDWNPATTVTQTVAARASAIRLAGALPVFVVYDIPLRDCNGYSGGGAPSAAAYKTWISSFTTGLGNGRTIVILEPDALAQLDCLPSSERSNRLALLSYAVRTLSAHSHTYVYIDAGHSGWIDAATMTQRLRSADVADARGFSLNVSNYDATNVERTYGDTIVNQLGSGKHFVVDTSRNGLGSSGEWCNAPGRALGPKPTYMTYDGKADAYLWIKRPGESDGTCNSGPPAGQFWTDYAIGLAQRAAY
jgi:endoglucanase